MSTSTEACWTCRRRRHKCDGTRPRCAKCQLNNVECLGYGKTKPLNWVNGIASRGRWKDCSTFDNPDPSPLAHKKYSRSDTFIPVFSTNLQRHQGADLRHPLVDPMYKDLGYDVRFLIDYFDRRLCPTMIVSDNYRNPYREIISRAGSSPVIAKAIVALSACHFSHAVTGVPIFSTTEVPDATNLFFNSDLSRYLRLKNTALKSLSEGLASPGQYCSYTDAIFAAFLLALLDLMEWGANSWTFHLEGAKKLLRTKLSEEIAGSTGLLERVANEIAVLDIIGSTLVQPNKVLPTLPDLDFGQTEMNKARGLTFVGCPATVISSLKFMTSQRAAWLDHRAGTASSSVVEVADLQATLRDIRQFDPRSWATDITSVDDDAHPLFSDLLHAGKIWRLAADIYATRVYHSITGDGSMAVPSLDELIAEFVLLGPHDSPERCLIWPTFIAGASSTRADQREWTMKTLEMIWQMTFSANCKSAAIVLKGLWEKQDSFRTRQGSDDLEGWDWVMEMTLQEDQWMFY